MNHIFRLVWCRSRRVLVVASELAARCHGSATGTADGRQSGSSNKLLMAALVGTSGALFVSGASAQSIGDGKLDDLQSLVAKYSTPDAASPAQNRSAAGQDAAGADEEIQGHHVHQRRAGLARAEGVADVAGLLHGGVDEAREFPGFHRCRRVRRQTVLQSLGRESCSEKMLAKVVVNFLANALALAGAHTNDQSAA